MSEPYVLIALRAETTKPDDILTGSTDTTLANAVMEDDEHLELRLRMLCEGWIRKVVRSRQESR